MLSGLAKGIGLGALAMYYFDPVVGRRRRSLLRDQLRGACNDVSDFVDRGWRDLTNRVEGFAAERRGALSKRRAPDDVLAQRVRATMGRYVSHPGAVQVDVEQGRVVLSGPILSDEVPNFVAAIKAVPGVDQVENRMDVRQEPDVSALQGGQSRLRESQSGFIGNRSPASRLVAATAGLMFLGNCAMGRSGSAALCGTLGAGLLASAVTGQSGLRMFQRRNAGARHGSRRTAEYGGQRVQVEAERVEGQRAFAEQSQWQAEQPQAIPEPITPTRDIAPPSRQLPGQPPNPII